MIEMMDITSWSLGKTGKDNAVSTVSVGAWILHFFLSSLQ